MPHANGSSDRAEEGSTRPGSSQSTIATVRPGSAESGYGDREMHKYDKYKRLRNRLWGENCIEWSGVTREQDSQLQLVYS